MKSFIYFLPGLINNASADDFKRVGLAHALTVGSPSSRSTTAGPDGLGGYLAVPTGAHAAPALYEPEKQIWRAGPRTVTKPATDDTPAEFGPAAYYVGYYTDAKPGPAALKRDRFVGGEELTLGDGQSWTIPIALSYGVGRGSTLPQRFVIGADGATWEMAALPEFTHLSAHAEKIVEAWLGGAKGEDGKITVSMDVLESLNMCVDAIACNYRVGAIEIDLLGLITTETRWMMLRALIDDIAREKIDRLGEKKSDTPGTSAT